MTTVIRTRPDVDEPEPAGVPVWDLEVKPDTDEPLRPFLCPADDEDEPPAGVPAIV